jgi:uncharacterized protein (TIGR01370 family)
MKIPRMVIAILILVTLLAVWFLIVQLQALKSAGERWVVYYTDKLPPSFFQPYDLIVFDRDAHPPLDKFKAEHKILLGYISLGEAETYRSTYAVLKEKNLLLETGPEWQGNPVIDVRKPEWNAYVLDVLIPSILKQGFDGIMVDTADSIVHLETLNPAKYSGLQAAFTQLIKQIRVRYPAMKIMLNRGFEILPQVQNDIDMVLAESIYANGNLSAPDIFPADVYQRYVDLLKNAQQQSKQLKIYTLD